MPDYPFSPNDRFVYSVSQLNREVKEALEGQFPLIWVEGEIANLSRPSSGHLYFTLKDQQTQVRCAMFRMRNNLLHFIPKDGMQVMIRARVTLYEARGDYQLVAEHMEESGEGLLLRAFEALKQKLLKEGLFEQKHKQPLPRLPQRIGVITSPTGAAIRDILTVLKRRFAAIPVLIYPVQVQGNGAAEQIAQAIALANERAECDVLIVGRGGGSLEDLWAFNEEIVARAIHASLIPIVCAVGHEVDVTIADLVADMRAPTPSAAAELLSPDSLEWLQSLDRQEQRLESVIKRYLAEKRQQLFWRQQQLQSPDQYQQRQRERLYALEHRIKQALRLEFIQQMRRVTELSGRLTAVKPEQRVKNLGQHADQLSKRLRQAMHTQLGNHRRELVSKARTLEAVSPLATLARGYSITESIADRRILRRSNEVKAGERIRTRLQSGQLVCIVESTE